MAGWEFESSMHRTVNLGRALPAIRFPICSSCKKKFLLTVRQSGSILVRYKNLSNLSADGRGQSYQQAPAEFNNRSFTLLSAGH